MQLKTVRKDWHSTGFDLHERFMYVGMGGAGFYFCFLQALQ